MEQQRPLDLDQPSIRNRSRCSSCAMTPGGRAARDPLCELENLPVLAFRRQRWLASPWLIYAVGDAFVGKWDRREIGGKPAAPVAIPRAPGRLLRVRPDSTNAGRGGCKCAAQGDWIEAPY